MLSPRSALRLACLLPLLAFSPRLAAEEEFQLTSGDVIVGTVVRETDQEVEISQLVLVDGQPKTSSFVMEKSQIAKRVTVRPLLEQYQERAQKVANTVDGQCALATWCWEHGLAGQAEIHAQKAEAVDGKDPRIAALFAQLGCVKDQGRWIRKSDGTALADLKAVAEAEQRQRQGQELAQVISERDAKLSRLKELDRMQIDSNQKVEEATKKVTGLTRQETKQREESARRKLALEEAENALLGAKNDRIAQHPESYFGELRKRIEDCRTSLNQGTDELQKTERKRAEAEQALATLRQSVSQIPPEIAAVRQELAQWEKEVSKLQATVGDKNGPPPNQSGPTGTPASGGAPAKPPTKP